VNGQPASAHNLPVLFINPLITPIKPVYSEPLSVTVPLVIITCTLLVVGWYGEVYTCTLIE